MIYYCLLLKLIIIRIVNVAFEKILIANTMFRSSFLLKKKGDTACAFKQFVRVMFLSKSQLTSPVVASLEVLELLECQRDAGIYKTAPKGTLRRKGNKEKRKKTFTLTLRCPPNLIVSDKKQIILTRTEIIKLNSTVLLLVAVVVRWCLLLFTSI